MMGSSPPLPMRAAMPHPHLSAIADLVTGYVNGFDRACAQFGLDVQTLETLLLDANVEACPGCDWYVDSHELLGEGDAPDGHCDNCRPS